jgi:hypothetical protein
LIINVRVTTEILKIVNVGNFSKHTKYVSKLCGRCNVIDEIGIAVGIPVVYEGNS